MTGTQLLLLGKRERKANFTILFSLGKPVMLIPEDLVNEPETTQI